MWSVQLNSLSKSRCTTSSSLVPEMRVCGMRGDEGLCLGRHWSEHALLVESNAVAATTILGGIKARASNLHRLSSHSTWFLQGEV